MGRTPTAWVEPLLHEYYMQPTMSQLEKHSHLQIQIALTKMQISNIGQLNYFDVAMIISAASMVYIYLSINQYHRYA